VHLRTYHRTYALPNHLAAVAQAELAKAALVELADAIAQEVQPCLKWLAELDVTTSLAEVSELNSFTKPELTEENILHIDKGAVETSYDALSVAKYPKECADT
jgi:DNA mismatch repair ATPase MutS